MEQKTPEQLFKEKSADNLLSYIIAKTFSRHSLMTEEEFLMFLGENKVSVFHFDDETEFLEELKNAENHC